jgi:hypothetical protein
VELVSIEKVKVDPLPSEKRLTQALTGHGIGFDDSTQAEFASASFFDSGVDAYCSSFTPQFQIQMGCLGSFLHQP